jgi:16S rRNA (guanine527-N7)-methyltransferase
MKKDIRMNKFGRLVSKAKSIKAKKDNRLEKNGFFASKGSFGVVKIDPAACKGKSAKKNFHTIKNGIFYLKGGDLTEELAGIKYPCKEFPISAFYKEAFFETKKVVYVQLVP